MLDSSRHRPANADAPAPQVAVGPTRAANPLTANGFRAEIQRLYRLYGNICDSSGH